MIVPVNGHIVIEPVVHNSFIATQKEAYDEIGVVVAVPEIFDEIAASECPKIGQKVFFDSWLASKYPTGVGDNYFWLVRYDDIRAIEV